MVLADIFSRIATGSGLPGDGHVIHSAVQGLAKFLWNGAPTCAKTCKAVLESESTWDVGSSRLAQVVIGESATGKDNCTDFLKRLLKELQKDEFQVVAQVIEQGMVTMSGLISILKENGGHVIFLNPELEKLLSKQRQQYLQAPDLIEVLDGSTTGRATSQDRSAPRPNAWATLGSQLGTYIREMTGDSCARLRLLPTFLDDTLVAETAFAEKFLPRQASEQLVASVLRSLMRSQHPHPQPVRPVGVPWPATLDTRASASKKR